MRWRASAIPEEWPSRIVARKRAMPYRTRLTGRLISSNEGFGAKHAEPLAICDVIPARANGYDATYATICSSKSISASGAVIPGA